MRAAYVTELGPAENIQMGELPEPTLAATDVLVQSQALAVNFVDTLVRSGRYPTPKPFPFVIGRDLVGVVAAVGDAVESRAAFCAYASVPGFRWRSRRKRTASWSRVRAVGSS